MKRIERLAVHIGRCSAALHSSAPAVRTEKNGSVTTIILSRLHAKNAVDGPTAELLAEAFREFEKDENAKVNTFCKKYSAVFPSH